MNSPDIATARLQLKELSAKRLKDIPIEVSVIGKSHAYDPVYSLSISPKRTEFISVPKPIVSVAGPNNTATFGISVTQGTITYADVKRLVMLSNYRQNSDSNLMDTD